MINILWLLQLTIKEYYKQKIESILQCKINIFTSLNNNKQYDIIIFDDYTLLKQLNIYQKRNLVFYVFNNHENIFDKQSIYINYYIRNKFLYKDLYKAILESQSILYEHMNILYFNKGNIYYQIKKSNIIYIESYRNSIVIHTQLTQYTLRCPLKNIQQKLGIKFIQCHKSFIINTDYISSIKENNIILNNGYIIPIGQKYKHSLTKHDKE